MCVCVDRRCGTRGRMNTNKVKTWGCCLLCSWENLVGSSLEIATNTTYIWWWVSDGEFLASLFLSESVGWVRIPVRINVSVSYKCILSWRWSFMFMDANIPFPTYYLPLKFRGNAAVQINHLPPPTLIKWSVGVLHTFRDNPGSFWAFWSGLLQSVDLDCSYVKRSLLSCSVFVHFVVSDHRSLLGAWDAVCERDRPAEGESKNQR